MTATEALESETPRARPYRVLVCDDQPDVLEAMGLLLKGEGYEVTTVQSPQSLLRAARSDHFDLILADLNYSRDTTSGEEGLDLLAGIVAQGNTTPIIAMTAWGSTDLAVEAMRRGACNFIQKPWDNRRVLSAVHNEARSRRLGKSELEIAAAVQQRMLPSQARPMRTIDCAGRCLAARSVGGDYYDFLDLDGDTLGFVLADVSGKGVPAALLMANLQACFRSQAVMGFNEPTILLEAVNRLFYASTDSDRFATLFFASYHDRARTLRYVNCGHVAPLLLRSTGEMESLEPTATVLGAFREWSCTERELTLRPGDTLLLYSDGITDGAGQDGCEFGEERIERALRDFHGGSAEDLVARILDAVSRFGGIRQGDDITVVAIRGV